MLRQGHCKFKTFVATYLNYLQGNPCPKRLYQEKPPQPSESLPWGAFLPIAHSRGGQSHVSTANVREKAARVSVGTSKSGLGQGKGNGRSSASKVQPQSGLSSRCSMGLCRMSPLPTTMLETLQDPILCFKKWWTDSQTRPYYQAENSNTVLRRKYEEVFSGTATAAQVQPRSLEADTCDSSHRSYLDIIDWWCLN